MRMNLDESQKLKAAFVATVLGAAAIEGTVFARQHHVPTGRDAFLHYQVDSTDELIAALKKNPTLRRNYARHFGIPENQVVDFVKRTLIPYRLPEGRQVTTYGVTKSGRIYPVKAFLRKGTLVWATRSGLPVLKWACANPLTKNLPGTLLSSLPHPIQNQALTRRIPNVGTVSSPELPLPPPNPLANVNAPLLSAPKVANVSSALTLPPALTGGSAVTLPAIASVPIPVSVSGGGSNVNSLIPLIPILVGTGIATNHGNNPGGGTNVGPPGGGGTAVPEPESVALILLAGLPILTGFAAGRRRWRRGGPAAGK